MTARPSLQVVVDDLQWVDDTSVALLHYAVRAAESGGYPLVLLAAGRPTATAARLAESLSAVVADPQRLVRLDLDPLDRVAGLPRAGTRPRPRRGGGRSGLRACRWLPVLDRGAGAGGHRAGRGQRAGATAARRDRGRRRPARRPRRRRTSARAGRARRRRRPAAGAGGSGSRRPRGARSRARRRGGIAVAHAIVRDRVLATLAPGTTRRVHRQLARSFERSGDRRPHAAGSARARPARRDADGCGRPATGAVTAAAAPRAGRARPAPDRRCGRRPGRS